MKKSILTPILAVIDIALLVLIVVSARSVGNGPTDTPAATAEVSIAEVTSPAETETVISPAETSVRQTQEETTESIPEVTAVPGSSVPETQTDPEPTAEETLPASAESTEMPPGSENWLSPGTETKDHTEEENFRDVSAYDTYERPHINDFKWVTKEILAGECPEEAEKIHFEESLGGWKCYIIDDATGMERLANMELSGTMEALELHFDWYYMRIGGKGGEAYEDNSEDSVFRGRVNDSGEIEAEGPGRIYVTDIYAISDHMYAFGTLHWPDGIMGYLFLARP